MNDTPRTDALLREADDSAPFVEFARQLERELAEVKKDFRDALYIALALTGYLESDHPDAWTLEQESKLRAYEKKYPCQ
jgi:hypothetical protein